MCMWTDCVRLSSSGWSFTSPLGVPGVPSKKKIESSYFSITAVTGSQDWKHLDPTSSRLCYVIAFPFSVRYVCLFIQGSQCVTHILSVGLVKAGGFHVGSGRRCFFPTRVPDVQETSGWAAEIFYSRFTLRCSMLTSVHSAPVATTDP